MSQTILVTGAAGGAQGSTGRQIAALLLNKGVPVRAFVHKLDARSNALRELGAEVVQGDLLDPGSVRASFRGIRRAYFTYPVTDGLLEATTIFAMAAREAGTRLVVNNSQIQGARKAPSFRNMQHGLADRIFDWAEVGAVHLHAPPYYENVRALVRNSVSEQSTVFLPWGDGSATIPLVGAEDVSQVAATLLASSETPHKGAYDLITATPTVKEIVDTFVDSSAIMSACTPSRINNEGHPEAMNPRNGNYGRGMGDWFGYRERLEQWLEAGTFEGLELEVRSTAS